MSIANQWNALTKIPTQLARMHPLKKKKNIMKSVYLTMLSQSPKLSNQNINTNSILSSSKNT